MSIAAIDIGTNSVRCTIVDAPVGGARRTLDDERAPTRLGRGSLATKRLADAAIDETVAALKRMLQIAAQYEVTQIRAVATAAVREADNAEEFLARVRSELDLEIEVISEQEEGRLAFLSAAESIGVSGRSAVIDIGGGSVEIVRSTDRQVEYITSLPIGAVAMTERYHTDGQIPGLEYKRLVDHVRRSLARALGDDPDPVNLVIGSGGTVGTVAALIAAKRDPSLTSLHGFVLRRAEVIHLLAALSGSSAEERTAMKGMPESRVDIILAGAIVVDECMRALGANEMVVNTRGIREGIVIDMLERERGSSAAMDRMEGVRDFGRRCHADAPHAEQVRRLSLQLFDAVSDEFGLGLADRALLETAALLHDVGYHIAYERHHRHSYHLISYAELPGFGAQELRLVAAIARYHRGALPKPKHEAMHDLNRADRALVSRLAALLRLADGLDRSRGQRVGSVEVCLAPGAMTIAIDGEHPLEVELHGSQRKADLFESVFNRRVDIILSSRATQVVRSDEITSV